MAAIATFSAFAIGARAAEPELPDNVERIDLRHSPEGLRKTYLDPSGRVKAGMQLPRIIVFDGEGRLLGGQVGFRPGDMRGLSRVAYRGRPFRNAPGLDDTLDELETLDGMPADVMTRPQVDVFVVVYRSGDCLRCDRMDAELRTVMNRTRRHRFAWLVVDSDPRSLGLTTGEGLRAPGR